MLATHIILKIGGSLLQSINTLRQLGEVISILSQSYPILVLPGGGPFADVVRSYGEKIPLSEETCHFMALLGMEQYAFLLQELIPNSRIVNLQASQNINDAVGQVLILRTLDYMQSVPSSDLSRSWEVTSDSIAAYLSQQFQAKLLVLLKSKDISPEIGPPEVDPFFRQTVPEDLPVWLVNGNYPERLKELLESGQTLGAHLGPPFLV